jgi:hypothetical protein
MKDRKDVIATDVLSPEFAGIAKTRLLIIPRKIIGIMM